MPREAFTSAGSPKKGRKWTPQLHKAFQEAAEAVGPMAAPAEILEHMGPAAAGLTRDAVAAHLQKHRSGVSRSGSRRSLDGGDGRNGLTSLRTLSTPNFSSRLCRRSPRTPRRGATLPAGLRDDLQRHSGTFTATEDAAGSSAAVAGANVGSGNGGVGCGLDPAWLLPPAQPPAHWCLGSAAGGVTVHGPMTGNGVPPAAFPAPPPGWGLPPAGCGIAALGQCLPQPMQHALQAALQAAPQQQPPGGGNTVTTGALGLAPQGGPTAVAGRQHGLRGLAAIATGDGSRAGSPCTGALPTPPAHNQQQPHQQQQQQQDDPQLQGCVHVTAAPQQRLTQQGPSQQGHWQQQGLTQQAPGSPDGAGAAAGDFGAAFDAAGDTAFDTLLGVDLSSDDDDGELWSMAELTAAALAIPPEVLAEADLQPLVAPHDPAGAAAAFAHAVDVAAAGCGTATGSAVNSAASSPSAMDSMAAAGAAAATWGAAAAAAEQPHPQQAVLQALQQAAAAAAAVATAPGAYRRFTSLPPLPFRAGSGGFGGAGAFAACLPPPAFALCSNSGGGGGGLAGYAAQHQGGSSPLAAAAAAMLQGGPPRLASLSAPAGCAGTGRAAADAAQYKAQHALMLEDLRSRPKEPPIGLKLDKQSVLEVLHATA